MTNRERARGVVDYWYDGTGIGEDTKNSMARVIERALDEACAEAVAAELLATRKMLDDLGYINASQHVKGRLDAIRERAK
jgi:hypothetical protein